MKPIKSKDFKVSLLSLEAPEPGATNGAKNISRFLRDKNLINAPGRFSRNMLNLSWSDKIELFELLDDLGWN